MSGFSRKVRWSFLIGVVASLAVLALTSTGWATSASAGTVLTCANPMSTIPGLETGITGLVTIKGTAPFWGALVQAYRQIAPNRWWFAGIAFTDATGCYRLRWLVPGQYRVQFIDLHRHYRSEYYNDARTFETATNVTVVQNVTTTGINANLDAPLPPLIQVITSRGQVTSDPQTGLVTLVMQRYFRSDATFIWAASCPAGKPTNVALVLQAFPNVRTYSMTETPANSGSYRVTVPAADLVSAGIKVRQTCSGSTSETQVGQLLVLDARGFIYGWGMGRANMAVQGEAVNGPIQGAMISLYQVPGWRARTDPTDTAPETCESNASRQGQPWSQAAPTDLGAFVDSTNLSVLESAQSSTSVVNPLVTDETGGIVWDAPSSGCWYLVVHADGYLDAVSPVFGSPADVTDVTVEMQPASLLFLPVVSR